MNGRFIFMLVFFIVITGLLEWYTYAALSGKWNQWSNWLKHTTRIIYFLLMGLSIASIIAVFAFEKHLPRSIMNFFFSFVVFNLIVKTAFAAFLFIDDLRRLIVLGKNAATGAATSGISRSDFLTKTGLVAAAIPFAGLSWGMIAGPYRYKVFKEKVKLPNLPKGFEGLRIVQISDIHSGSFYSKTAVERGIQMILDQQPDVIFFTGDLVNNKAEEMEPYIESFARLTAPLGVYSILGNHDYGDYVNWESEEAKIANNKAVRDLHGRMGWRLLLDEHVYLERNGDKIGLIGVENWGKGFHQEGDLAKAYEGIDADIKLLLSHDPTHFEEIVTKGFKDINLTFSGHTHGMQMGIETANFKWSPISWRYSKWAGLYEENGQYLYVNRGFGFLGYAGRLGIMPEITVLELEKA